MDKATALQDPVQDSGGQVFVMQDLSHSLSDLLVVKIMGRFRR